MRFTVRLWSNWLRTETGIYLGANTLLPQSQASSAGGIRNPCCTCDALGALERINKCWSNSLSSPFCQLVLWGSPLWSAQDHSLAPISIPCSCPCGVRQARCHWGSPAPEAVCRGNRALHSPCILSVTALTTLHLSFPTAAFPSHENTVHTGFLPPVNKYFWVVILIRLHNCLAEQIGYKGT